MNFISINKFDSSENAKADNQKKLFNIAEYRKHDYEKFEKILNQMWTKLDQLHEDFSFSIEKNKLVSAYTGFGRDHRIQYTIKHKFKDVESQIQVDLPELIYDSYFILNNSYYIPTMVLERLPIDKNIKKKTVFISISNKVVFAIKPKKARSKELVVITSKNKVVSLDYFASAIFYDRPEYLEELKDRGLIKKIYKYNKVIKEVIKAIGGFFNADYFKNEMLLPDFINEYYVLPYHRKLWQRIYGVDKFEDLFYLAIKALFDENQEYFDLSDLRNRRLVMTEYLISPLYDAYHRILNLLTDKEGARQIVLPAINSNTIISTGFRDMLHGKQIYDISSPWAVPLMYKVSQKITIIQKDVPKSWAQLHDTQFGIVDPINISPSDFGSVLTHTSNAKVDEFGMFEIPGNGIKTFEFPSELN